MRLRVASSQSSKTLKNVPYGHGWAPLLAFSYLGQIIRIHPAWAAAMSGVFHEI